MKKIASALLLVLMHHSSAEAAWSFAWSVEPSSGDHACTASSDPASVRTGAGTTETVVRLGVQGDGLMTIRSDSSPFDADKLYTMWVRVDDNPLAVHLNRSPDGRTLTFTEEDSVSLHRQFETGTSISISVAFAPPGTPVVKTFSLEGYPAVTAQYKGCRGLLLNPGWMGVSMTAAPKDDAALSWIAANTPYRTSGILLVTVDPRKEAFRNDLRPGDRILGLNGTDADVPAFINALKNMVVNGTIALDVLRDRTVLKKIVTRPDAGPRNTREAD